MSNKAPGDSTHSRARDEKGRFTSDVGKEDIYRAMDRLEPYTTRELANRVGCSRRAALNYLDELANEERVRKKKPEPRRSIWIRED